MKEFVQHFQSAYPLNPQAIVFACLEIFIFSFFFYWLINVVKGTRGENVGKGLLILVSAFWITKPLGLYEIHWVLEKVVAIVFIALPIVFQPELRRAFERLGRSRFWVRDIASLASEERTQLIAGLSLTAFHLAQQRHGAIIVIERAMNIKDFVEGGVSVDAKVTPELLLSIFTPPGPLHDGACVIRGGRVAFARCFLPLTDNPDVSPVLGSRHRAAIGVTEQTDALVIVVSEESAAVSVCQNGRLTKVMDDKALREALTTLISLPSRM